MKIREEKSCIVLQYNERQDEQRIEDCRVHLGTNMNGSSPFRFCSTLYSVCTYIVFMS